MLLDCIIWGNQGNRVKRKFFYLFIPLLLFLFLGQNALFSESFQEKYFDPENILRFAEALFQEGDYLRAVGEFQRYLYFSNKSAGRKDYVYYQIGLSFSLAQEHQRSKEYFNKIVSEFPGSPYTHKAFFRLAYSCFITKDFEESLAKSKSYLPLVDDKKIHLKLKQLGILNQMYLKNWRAAEDSIDALEDDEKSDKFTGLLEDFTERGKDIPQKSKFLAGLLSAIIPGTGKIYAKRTTDGLVSFFTIAATAWQAYDGFKKDGVKSVKGWISGSLGAFLYIGNIYGSAVAVKIHNKQHEENLFKDIEITVNVYFH